MEGRPRRAQGLRGSRPECDHPRHEKKKGTLGDGDPQLATYAFLGIINYSTQWYDVSGAKSADEIAETFATIFLRGIGA